MIEKQRKQDGKCYVSTVVFDNESKVVHDRIELSKIPKMTEKDYSVGGCTALIDAIGGATQATATRKISVLLRVIVMNRPNNARMSFMITKSMISIKP